jgi:glycosyltransferase involved in cell wall biosynthesis
MSERPLRVLMIHNHYLTFGGEDLSTATHVELLRDAGHQVELLEYSNQRVETLGRVRTAGRSLWSQEAYAWVARELSAQDYDVVHVQNFFPLFSPSVYYAAGRRGVPVVQSLRNFRLVCPEGMLHRDGAVCTDCVGKLVALPGIRYRCYRGSMLGTTVVAGMSTGHRMIGTWRRKVFRYVAPSDYARGVFLAGGWDGELIDVIPNSVYPDPGPGAGTGGYALFAGRLAGVKGLDTLFDAWNRGGIDFPLKIVGSGPERSRVEQAAAGNPLIEYLGSVSPGQVAELMGDAAFVVVPTRGIETFGRVAVEAMAKGTPPIVADHGGLAETVADGKTGLRFPPGDAVALAGAVRQLVADPAHRVEMRAAARAAFLSRFTGERTLERWLELYRTAAAARGGPNGSSGSKEREEK